MLHRSQGAQGATALRYLKALQGVFVDALPAPTQLGPAEHDATRDHQHQGCWPSPATSPAGPCRQSPPLCAGARRRFNTELHTTSSTDGTAHQHQRSKQLLNDTRSVLACERTNGWYAPSTCWRQSHNRWSRPTALLYTRASLWHSPLVNHLHSPIAQKRPQSPGAPAYQYTLHRLSHVSSTSAAACLHTTNFEWTCPKTGRPWHLQQHTACLTAMQHAVAASLQHLVRQRAAQHCRHMQRSSSCL